MRSSRSRRAELDALGAVPFAHRGLHGPGRTENGLLAFADAANQGYGIELDVQISRDGEAVVFHDYELDRLTIAQGPVADWTAEQLRGLRLYVGLEGIPTLRDALDLIAGRVPLLIEVKSPDRDASGICGAVERALGPYDGPVGVMSFNPQVGAWFARHAPGRLRGLVVTESGRRGLGGRLQRTFSLWRSRADFLAYDIRDLPSPFAAAARRRGRPVYTWTVRTAEEQGRADLHADQMIFELPPL